MKRVILVLCILSLLSCLLSSAVGLAGVVRYKYDGAGRLVGIKYDNGVTIVYTYDQMGNRLTETVQTGESATDAQSEPAQATENDNDG